MKEIISKVKIGRGVNSLTSTTQDKGEAFRKINKEDVPQCGVMWTDSKVKSMTGKGSVGLYKVSSRMAKLIGEQIRMGKDPRFTIISKLDDPDAFGAERVAIKNVSFDDLTLADWESAVFGKVECPFTFGDYEYLDKVDMN